MTSIFQIDWIFVDTIIIILLILLLLSVKIFKLTHRWRYSFSNQALEHKCFLQTQVKAKNNIFLTKKWYLTRNSTQQERDLPLILIFKMNYKRKLLRILTEGLSSYGFTIISVKAKIKHIPDSNVFEKAVVNEWKALTSAIIGNFKHTEIISPKFVLLNGSKSIFPFIQILSNSDNIGAILINPRIDKKHYSGIFRKSAIASQIYSIFSRKSILIFKNKHLIRFLNEIYPLKDNVIKYITIEKATNSFKYYETILLGIIIDILENKLLKSKT